MTDSTQSSGGGLRYDAGKPRVDLLCPIAMIATAAVLEAGSRKYAEGNWAKGMSWRKVIACTLRHLFKFMMGEDLDAETGLPHIDHAACNIMFLQNYFRLQKPLDDRFSAVYRPKQEVSNNEPKKEG